MIEGKTIFITGGAGFIGSTLAGRLVAHNKIVIFDNLTRNSIKDRDFKDHPNLTLVEGDILDYAAVGSVINHAQRLQEAGKTLPAAVVCGAGTFALCRDAFAWRDLGSIALKGIGAVRAYAPAPASVATGDGP